MPACAFVTACVCGLTKEDRLEVFGLSAVTPCAELAAGLAELPVAAVCNGLNNEPRDVIVRIDWEELTSVAGFS